MATRQRPGLLWQVLFRIEPGRPAVGVGLRVAAAIVVPLVVGLGTNHLTMGAAASLGALNVTMADSGGPERTRAVALTASAVANSTAFVLGLVSARTLGLAVPLMFIIAFAGGLATLYGREAAIVGFVTTVVFILGLGFPPGAVSAPEAVWLTLLGGAWAMVLALALWPLRPYAAAQHAVAACYTATARLVVEACSPTRSADTVARASRSAREALEGAGATLRATRFGRDDESAPGRVLAALHESAGVLLDVGEALTEEVHDRRRFPEAADQVREAGERVGRTLRSVGSVVRAGGRPDLTEAETSVRALAGTVSTVRAAVMNGTAEGSELAGLLPVNSSFHHLLDGVRESSALAMELHGELVGGDARSRASSTGPALRRDGRRGRRREWWTALTSNLTLDSVAFRHAVRYATVTAVGVITFRGLNLPKGYWVALTIAVILKPYAGVTFQQTLLRIGGTVLGALLAVAITASVTSDWGTVLLMIPLAVIGFSFQQLNYGLWVVFFTPLVILITEVAHPGQWTLAGWRIADTLIGAALALAGSYLLWPGSSRSAARRQLGAAVAANRVYFCAVMRRYVWPGPTTEGLDEPHRRAALAADNSEADLQRLLGERPGGGAFIEQFWSLVGANRRVYSALTALEAHLHVFTGRHALPGLPDLCHGIDAALSDLTGAVRDDRPPAPLPVLDLPLGAARDHLAAVNLARAEERTTGASSSPLVEELRDESLVATEVERLVRGVEAMHSALAGH